MVDGIEGGTDAGEIRVDVVRPADLVALTFVATGCELVTGDAQPYLRPVSGGAGHLTVVLAYQHLGERAIYEAPAPAPVDTNPAGHVPNPTGPVDGEAIRPDIPEMQVRPARASRLVFEAPAGEVIPFSSAGLLAAVGRLRLLVHPLATPAPPPVLAPDPGPVLHLPGGIAAALSDRGPVLSRLSAAERRQAAADPAGDLAMWRDLRRARAGLAGQAGVVVGRNVVLGALDGLAGPPVIVRRPPIRPRPILSRPPTPEETALEAPFRLVVSPSPLAGWAHAARPVRAGDTPNHVELWHSRLGVRDEHPDGSVGVDERTHPQRKIRAVWARDRESMPGWEAIKAPIHDTLPFRMSLDGADRHMLVRQTAETWLGKRDVPLLPAPVDARKLWLSALGAWVDFHGEWTTGEYSKANISSILSWDHEAPMGRDQYVRVVYPGFLFPFGHQAALVKLTERKMKDAAPSVAGLYQRKFLVIGTPARSYDDHHDLPFTRVEVAPLVTPTLDDPGNIQNTFFWPRVGSADFQFVLHCTDHEGKPVRLVTPLLWVAEQFTATAPNRKTVAHEYDISSRRKVAACNQHIAFAPASKGGDTTAEAVSVSFSGRAQGPPGTSTPRMTQASVLLQAVERISGVGPVPVAYAKPYKAGGFGGPGNTGEVWAEAITSAAQQELPNDDNRPVAVMRFGQAGAPAGTDKSGGFLAPEQAIRGLSRASGTVGDVAGMATNTFNPEEFLKNALPKLFGLVSLLDLLKLVAGKAPALVSEALDRAEGFLADLQRAKDQAADAISEAHKLVDRAAAKTAELQAAAQAAKTAAEGAQAAVSAAVDGFKAVLAGLAGATKAAVDAAVNAPLDALRAAVADLEASGPRLPPLIRNQLASLTKVLKQVLAAANLVDDLFRLVNGLAQSGVEARFRFEWKPELQSWPSPAHPFVGITDPILEVNSDSLVLAVEGRASGTGVVGAEILAELKDFVLHLLPGAPLVRIPFEHLSFKAGSSGKAEVDVVLGKTEFVGILAFVEVLKELIPFDGFSDPPYLDVTPAGLTAGFTLALPSVAIGVFSLANVSLGADIGVPFLGKVVSVGFNFCTRERPFTLTVSMIGGGGWFGIRLSPDGLDVLELGLEAAAVLSVDLGVASGSVSVEVGIYMRLEGKTGSLTGFVRIRGEVDVLGLVSASIELYLELRYEPPTGKMTGRASLTIQIKVFVFSGSVRISVERKFAGSNGDPAFAEVMAVAAGKSLPWSEYCTAFAGG